MRAVTRTGPDPASLASLNQAGRTELEEATLYYGQVPAPTTAYDFKRYKGDDVKTALEALFYGKCAYCESYYAGTAPMDVEHYRPKGGVEGEPAHPGYWWLAATYLNLLPSCIDCNRRRTQRTPQASASLSDLAANAKVTAATLLMSSGKKDCFPIAGARAANPTAPLGLEQPLLLNPCDDEPEDHVAFNVDPQYPVSVMFPKPVAVAPDPLLPGTGNAGAVANHAVQHGLSVRGAVSIQVYGLNRLSLVQQRTRVLRHLEFLGQLIIDLASLQDRVAVELAQGANALLSDVADKLAELETRILDELKAMKEPDAPHSTMAAVWLKSFTSRLA